VVRSIIAILLVNKATNTNNAGISTAFPNLTTLDMLKHDFVKLRHKRVPVKAVQPETIKKRLTK